MNQFRITKCIHKSKIYDLVYLMNTAPGAYIENRICSQGGFIVVTVVAATEDHAEQIRTWID
jgi:hypothetical protein